MNIKKTVYPDHQPDINEWTEEFKVSSRVVKRSEGQDRAQWMMQQWQKNKYEFIFRNVAQNISEKEVI